MILKLIFIMISKFVNIFKKTDICVTQIKIKLTPSEMVLLKLYHIKQ